MPAVGKNLLRLTCCSAIAVYSHCHAGTALPQGLPDQTDRPARHSAAGGVPSYTALLAEALSLDPDDDGDSRYSGRRRPYGYGRELTDSRPANFGGLARDTAYFMGYQFAVIGVLYVLPEGISGWSSEQKSDYSISKWKHNVTNAQWDQDNWWINYILHPYWGMAYYVRGRERGLSRPGSFMFSVFLSTLYEFGLEAMFEPVSKQDMIITPVVGSAVGLYVERLRRDIKRKSQLGVGDQTILIATDPLGALNSFFDGIIARFVAPPAHSEVKLGFSPSFPPSLDPSGRGYAHLIPQSPLGIQVTLHWR